MTELTWSSGHDKIAAAFAAGRAPDVLELGSDWVYEFASRNTLSDITNESIPFRDRYLGWESCTVDGRIYGIPWMLGTRAIFYNKSLVTHDSIRSLAELTEAVKRVHHPEQGIYGFGNTKKEPHQLYKKILPFFWSFGGSILSHDGDSCFIDSEENVRALNAYLQLCQYGLLESQKNLDDEFVKGNIGFVFSGGWLIKRIHDQNPALKYGIILFPQCDSSHNPYSFYGGEYLVINNTSARKTLAMDFIRFLVSKENALKLASVSKVTLPAERMSENDPYFINNPMEKILWNQLVSSKPSPLHPQWVKIENIIEEEVEQAVYGKKDAQDALRNAQLRIQKLLMAR